MPKLKNLFVKETKSLPNTTITYQPSANRKDQLRFTTVPQKKDYLFQKNL